MTTKKKTINDLLLLGDPRLYEVSQPIVDGDRSQLEHWVAGLHQVMQEVREKFGFGRGIAAPQLGIMKRLIYLHIDQPIVLVNPILSDFSVEKFELWDDCMSFPNLLVKVKRHKRLKVTFLNADWKQEEWWVEDDLSELIQHENDHLDGILATMRAMDNQSFKWKS